MCVCVYLRLEKGLGLVGGACVADAAARAEEDEGVGEVEDGFAGLVDGGDDGGVCLCLCVCVVLGGGVGVGGAEARDEGHDFFCGYGVEAGCWFIEEEQGGGSHELHPYTQPLQLPPRDASIERPSHLPIHHIRQPKQSTHLHHPLLPLPPPPLHPKASSKHQRLSDSQNRHMQITLPHIGTVGLYVFLPGCVCVGVSIVFYFSGDGAFGETVGEKVEEGALASSTRA